MSISRITIKSNMNECLFFYRTNSEGDKGVIKQIFVNQDYNILHWTQGRRLFEYHRQISQHTKSLIIDAGANIGASSVYFSMHFDNSIIFAIEPEDSNFKLLSINTKNHNCINFKGAISGIDEDLSLVDPNRSDWGFMTLKTEQASSKILKNIRAISPNTILKNTDIANSKPLIFKIDVEGAEEMLFSNDISWLGKFPLVIIELHDWMLPFSGSSRNFIKAIANFEFDFLHKGENIFLFNRSILN